MRLDKHGRHPNAEKDATIGREPNPFVSLEGYKAEIDINEAFNP